MHNGSYIRLIVFLIVIAYSVFQSWMRKKRQAEQARQAARNPLPPTPVTSQNRPPMAGTTPRPAKPASWEEELRKLLEGETPFAPPMRPQPPPPVTGVPPIAPRTISMPPLRPATPARTPAPVRPAVVRPAIVRFPESSPAPLPVPTVTSPSTRDLATMSQSRVAYEKAQQLGQQVAAHIDKIPTQRVQLTSVTRTRSAAELSQAVAMFRNARAARQAVIVSLVLGPPRGLESGDIGAPTHF